MTIDFQRLSQDELAVYLDGLILMSQIFWGPETGLCADMQSRSFREELLRLGDLLDEEGAGSARAMAAWIDDFPEADNLADRLETDYVRLFVNAAGGIKAPLHQSCYESEDGLLMGPAAINMRHRLETAGLASAVSVSTPPDHLAVELEYLIFLIDLGYSEENNEILAQAVDFATRELRPWVKRFSARLDEEKDNLFFPAASGILVSMLDLAEVKTGA